MKKVRLAKSLGSMFLAGVLTVSCLGCGNTAQKQEAAPAASAESAAEETAAAETGETAAAQTGETAEEGSDSCGDYHRRMGG